MRCDCRNHEISQYSRLIIKGGFLFNIIILKIPICINIHTALQRNSFSPNNKNKNFKNTEICGRTFKDIFKGVKGIFKVFKGGYTTDPI